jgi:crotonobetainyl-CoA:carnitine CoA-transferase CaiB-like acyl-CoA transferase
VPSAPEKFATFRATIRRPAPTLGEHNEYVLGKLLGMSNEEMQRLADEQIIGTWPMGV